MENKKLYDRIINRLDERKTAYSKFNSARDSIATYFRQDLGLYADGDGGSFFGSSIYEGSGAWVCRTAAKGFQGNMVSPSIDWIQYLMGQIELRGIDELDKWCEDIKEHNTSAYRRSNLYSILPNYTLDGLTIGSPVVIAEEDILGQKVMFIPQFYKHVYSFYDKFNQSCGLVVEDDTWRASKIFETFVPEDRPTKERLAIAKKIFSPALYQAIEQDTDKTFTIIRAIFKSNDNIWNTDDFEKPTGNFKYYSVYFESVANKVGEHLPLRTGGYFVKPWMTWDFDKKPWEASSRTPAFNAIYDVITHQQFYRNYLENIQLKNNPPRFVLNQLMNRLKLGPDGLTPVSEAEYDRLPKPVDLVGDVLYSKDLTLELRRAEDRHFDIDLYLRINRFAEENRQPPSATQIIQMAAENSTMLSPAVETYTRDLLQPADDIIMAIEMAAGRGPFDPQTMANITDIVDSNSKQPIDSIRITPEYIGLLAQSQRMQQTLDPLQTSLGAIANYMQLFPAQPIAIRHYETQDELLKATRFPSKLVMTKQEYDEQVAAMNQKAAQDEQFMKNVEMAKAAKNISSPVDKTSVLAGLAGAA
ncbi:MAG: portal protein [Phycisphaerae bacterium]|nr:portal protein [Phycisphaerae bacterium]